jgi:hypothetical protein
MTNRWREALEMVQRRSHQITQPKPEPARRELLTIEMGHSKPKERETE